LTIDLPGLRLTGGRAPAAGLGRVAAVRVALVGGLLEGFAEVDGFPDDADGVRGLADLPAVLGLLGGLRCAIGLVSVLGLSCAASSLPRSGREGDSRWRA
jgi:hypothetical protein